MKEETDSLEVTVSKSGSGDTNFGTYYRGEIEEDVYHPAELVRIEIGEGNYKGKTFPAWNWIYELTEEEFEVETDDGVKRCQVRERTSQKLTGAPRRSRAFERYSQLTGGEPEPGDTINLKELFGVNCKLMIKNAASGKDDNDGNEIIYHNIEKVSIKGVKTEKTVEKKATKKVKSKVKEVEEETKEDSDEGMF